MNDVSLMPLILEHQTLDFMKKADDEISQSKKRRRAEPLPQAVDPSPELQHRRAQLRDDSSRSTYPVLPLPDSHYLSVLQNSTHQGAAPTVPGQSLNPGAYGMSGGVNPNMLSSLSGQGGNRRLDGLFLPSSLGSASLMQHLLLDHHLQRLSPSLVSPSHNLLASLSGDPGRLAFLRLNNLLHGNGMTQAAAGHSRCWHYLRQMQMFSTVTSLRRMPYNSSSFPLHDSTPVWEWKLMREVRISAR